MTEKDYCDSSMYTTLEKVGFPLKKMKIRGSDKSFTEKNIPVLLYDVQTWLMKNQDIFIYPVIDKFLDEDGDTTWISYMFIPYIGIKALCRRKKYEDALLEGIKVGLDFIITHRTKNNDD